MTYDEFIEGINNPDKIKQMDFYIDGSEGKFTLKDVWNKVVITKIEYFKK